MAKGNRLAPVVPKGGSRLAPALQPANEDRNPPVFCLHHIQSSHCLSDCDQEEAAAFAHALWKRSKVTWGELRLAHRYGLGAEKIPSSAIRATLPPIANGVDFFLAFRFHAKAPMVGIRVGRIFHVLWLDREFNLYDHGD